MLIEVQISSQQFCRLVRERLKAIPMPLDCSIVDGETIFAFDQIEFLDNTTVRRDPQARQVVWINFPHTLTSFTMPSMQLLQKIAVKLVSVTDLEANGPLPSPNISPEPIFTLVFNVWMTTTQYYAGTGGQPILKAQFDSIDYGIFSDLIPSELKTKLTARLAGLSLPDSTIDLGFLGKYIGGEGKAYNAAVNCDGTGDIISMRIDLGKEGDFVPEFYTQDPENLLQGSEWAICMGSKLFTAPAESKIHEKLKETANVRINRAPSAWWNASGPGVSVYTEIEAIDACPFFVDDIDMDVTANLTLTFSKASANTLRTRFTMDVELPNPLEDMACAATAALFWPIIGVILTDKYDLDLGIYFLGLLTGPAPECSFVALMLAMMLFSNKVLSVHAGGDQGGNCSKISDSEYQCDEPWAASLPGIGGRLDLETVRGIERGLVLAGKIISPMPPPEPHITSVEVTPFAWQIEGKCRKQWSIVTKGKIFVAQQPPVVIWSVCKLNDTLGEFVVSIEQQTITIKPTFKTAYLSAPYPLKLRVITSKGVRTITLDPPSAITQDEKQLLEVARMRAIASCYRWERNFTRLEQIKWLIDPPFDRGELIQLWQFAASGLPERASLVVSLEGERRLITARPSSRGVAHFTVMTGDRGFTERVEMRVTGDVNEVEQAAELSYQQLLYQRVAVLEAPTGLRSMYLANSAGEPVLTVKADRLQQHWNLSVPMMPVLSGIQTIEREAASTTIVHLGREIRDELNEQLESALHRLGVRAGEGKVVATPKIGGLRQPVFVGSESGGVLYDLERSESNGEPFAVHEYEGMPWFVGSTLEAELMVRHDVTKKVLTVYQLVGSVMV